MSYVVMASEHIPRSETWLDVIVLDATHLCVCQAGLIACWTHLSLFLFLFFSKQTEFHIERSWPMSPGWIEHNLTSVMNTASMQFHTFPLNLMDMDFQNRQPAKVSPCCWEGALIACAGSAPADDAPAAMTSTLCASLWGFFVWLLTVTQKHENSFPYRSPGNCN